MPPTDYLRFGLLLEAELEFSSILHPTSRNKFPARVFYIVQDAFGLATGHCSMEVEHAKDLGILHFAVSSGCRGSDVGADQPPTPRVYS